MDGQALKIPVAVLSLLSLCFPGYIKDARGTESDEEECIFDQDEQIQAYLELEKKYAGSRFVAEEYKLVIPKDGDEITLRRGGCVHFGIYIEFRTPQTEEFEQESDFFSKVSDLVDEYGQGLIKPEMLKESISDEKWDVTRLDDGIYYFLYYPDATFEIWQRHEQEHTVIGVSFYY